MCGAIFFLHVVNIEKFRIYKYLSQRSNVSNGLFYLVKNLRFIVGIDLRVGKKHVFGSSVGCRGGGCQTLACVGSPGISMKIMAFSVICRVIVMLI